jgi:hypothetical protein
MILEACIMRCVSGPATARGGAQVNLKDGDLRYKDITALLASGNPPHGHSVSKTISFRRSRAFRLNSGEESIG